MFRSAVALALLLLVLFGFVPLIAASLTQLSNITQLMEAWSSEYSVVPSILQALFFSVEQSAWSATFTVLLALIFGRSVYFYPHAWGRGLVRLATVPFGLPSVVLSFAFIIAYGNSGFINDSLSSTFGFTLPFLYNKWAIVHAHVYFNLGMCAQQFLIRYQAIPSAHWRASLAMNLSPWLRFRHVELPQLLPTAFNLWFLVFAFCLTSFAVILTLGGSPDLTTLEVLIYQFVRYDNDTGSAFLAAAAQFVFLLLVSLVLLLSVKKIGASLNLSNKETEHINRNPYLTKESRLPNKKLIPTLLIFTPVVLIPLLAIVADGLAHITSDTSPPLLPQLQTAVLPALLQSLQIAVPAALGASLLSLVLSLSLARFSRSMEQRALIDVLSFGLIAFSPTVLAFSWFEAYLGLEINPFEFSGFTVVAIQVFLFAPFCMRIILPLARENYGQWRQTYDALSLPLGLQTLWVEARALRKPLASAFLLSLAFSVGDVSTPALFGDVHFQPLSLLLLDLLGSYQFGEASVAALVLLLLTQALLLFSSRRSSGAQS